MSADLTLAAFSIRFDHLLQVIGSALAMLLSREATGVERVEIIAVLWFALGLRFVLSHIDPHANKQ